VWRRNGAAVWPVPGLRDESVRTRRHAGRGERDAIVGELRAEADRLRAVVEAACREADHHLTAVGAVASADAWRAEAFRLGCETRAAVATYRAETPDAE